ncbi:sodium:proton antiporter NhaD [Halosquirtibacter laminarini]|uniref:Sodium:proton antiporter NhaD n=1 Tax=Halosquirtibacter laminarini TaxID=3374600 RepID=A0AC61NLB7_9BACT|nr:sodium:proton antiporter NhaD [Prolixibacteraceae bacterium]
MFSFMLIVFIIGYLAIIFESNIKISKTASALFMGVAVWIVYSLNGFDILSLGHSHSWHEFLSVHPDSNSIKGASNFILENELFSHLSEVASIIFFLLGAMTIVEIIDRYQGFKVITSKIHQRSRVKLLWIIGTLAFIMSSVLDNLTTTIVIISLLNKLISEKEERWLIAGIVVIAANAGGAWSPIGDVTTIMLWIGEQVTTVSLIKAVLIPSIVNILVPLTIASFFIKGKAIPPTLDQNETKVFTTKFERNFVFTLGISALLFVPILKTWTGLPPYMGMLFGLSIMWTATEVISRRKDEEDRRRLNAGYIIKKLDTPTILYFTGILLAVSALSSAGQLDLIAEYLDDHIGNIYGINLAIGALSSVVDNSSLVAATMGMYETAQAGATGYLSNFVQNGDFWTFLTYCAGTGGSLMIIGSAAGVAAMGIEKIPFGWYFKRISWMALAGFLAGALTFYLLN